MGMLGGIFGFGRHSPLELAEEMVRAINTRDFESLSSICQKGFTFIDGDGNRIEGCDNFITAMQGLIAAAPDFKVEVDRFDLTDETVIMHGQTLSQDPGFASESLWRFVTRRGKLHLLENYNANARERLVNYVPGRESVG